MMTATPVHPEGPRYGASIVFVSGVWVSPDVWRPVASYLAHRGWLGALLDVRTVGGRIATRADRVADYVRALPTPPVVIGHDAGALVALATAARVPVRALVLLSPLVPGTPGTHSLAWSRRLAWSLFRRTPLAPPPGPVGAAFFAGLSDAARVAVVPEDPRLLAELARRSPIVRPPVMPPALVLRGGDDPLVSHDDAHRLATDLGAEIEEIPGRGHWLLAPPAGQECVHRVHRWLVQNLAEGELEFYAEAMAESDPSHGSDRDRTRE